MITRKELVNTLLGSVPCSCCEIVPPVEELVVWGTDHTYLIEYYTAEKMKGWVKYLGKTIEALAPNQGGETYGYSYLLCKKCSDAPPRRANFTMLGG